MRTRVLIASMLFVVPAMLCGQTPAKPSTPRPSSKMTAKPSPEAVHRSAIVIDTHADTPQRFVDENFDMGDPLRGGNFNLESIHKGNLGAEFFSIWVEPTLYKGQYARRTLVLIDAVKQQVAKHPDQIMFVTSPEGIEFAHREHKFAALMGIEGGHSIEDSLALLRQYYALGVRYMTLTWSTHYLEEAEQCNRLGMMVDISHVSDRTFFRTLNISRAPVIASHSGARALCDAPRNMTDDMLRAVANYGGGPNSKGGVVQVNFYSAFVSQAYRDAQKAQKPEVDKAVQNLKDKDKAEGRQLNYEDISKVERQGCRSGSRGPRLRLRRRGWPVA